MVGVQGLVKVTFLKEALEFLAIQTTAWKSILEASVLVRISVEGFAFLSQVRFSTHKPKRHGEVVGERSIVTGLINQEDMPTVEPTVNGDARNWGRRTWGS